MLNANRAAKVLFELSNEVKNNLIDPADWAALGASIAIKADNRIPAVLNLPMPLTNDAAKIVTACASPGMNDPMLHLMGISPDSPTLEAAFGGTIPMNVEKFTLSSTDLKERYQKLSSAKNDRVDIIYLGCPHITYTEIRQIARMLDGKRVSARVNFWVQTDTPSYYMAQYYGEAKVIENAGGKIYHSTCFGALPIRDFGTDVNVATNSFKAIKLMGGQGQGWIFGAMPDLINAAVTGKFVSTRWA